MFAPIYQTVLKGKIAIASPLPSRHRKREKEASKRISSNWC